MQNIPPPHEWTEMEPNHICSFRQTARHAKAETQGDDLINAGKGFHGLAKYFTPEFPLFIAHFMFSKLEKAIQNMYSPNIKSSR